MQRSKESLTTKQQFDITVDLGELILPNGGDLFRAQETMERAAAYFGLTVFSILYAGGRYLCLGGFGIGNPAAQHYVCLPDHQNRRSHRHWYRGGLYDSGEAAGLGPK